MLCLTFMALDGLVPQYLTEQITHYESARWLRSADIKQLLAIEKIDTKTFGTGAFAYAAPTLYNTLSLTIKQLTSIAAFTSSLKTHFFTEAYITQDCL